MDVPQISTSTPLAIFVYKRPLHLKKVWDSLLQCPEIVNTPVFIFADGPKESTSNSVFEQVQEVRRLIKSFKGALSIQIIESSVNMGLSRSVISGVSMLLEKVDRVIILEDDIIVSPSFLTYMNAALSFYSDDKHVGSIHAYSYPIRKLPPFYFQRGGDCWGWGTWKRAWQYFEWNGQKLFDQLKSDELIHEFDYGGAYKFSSMLDQQIKGNNDSWAIRWHASLFLKNMLTLYPGHSFVDNIGNDDSGTHSSQTSMYGHKNLNESFDFDFSKIPVKHNTEVAFKIAKWFKASKTRLYRIGKRIGTIFFDRKYK